MSKLSQVVSQMEKTRASTDHVAELRRWRLEAEQRFMAVVVRASKPKGPRK